MALIQRRCRCWARSTGCTRASPWRLPPGWVICRRSQSTGSAGARCSRSGLSAGRQMRHVRPGPPALAGFGLVDHRLRSLAFAQQSVRANTMPGGAWSFVVVAGVFGLGWAWLAQRSGSIRWTTAAHILFDFAGREPCCMRVPGPCRCTDSTQGRNCS